MKIKTVWCFAIFYLFFLTSQPVLASEAWLLHQDYLDRGKVDVYVTDNAVKIVNKTFGYSAICRAPDWVAGVYRAEGKICWTCALDKFNGKLLTDPMGSSFSITNPISSGETINYKGLKCNRFTTYKGSRSVLLGSNDIKTQKPASEFLCRYFDCALMGQVPVYFLNDKGEAKNELKKSWFTTSEGLSKRSGLVKNLDTISWQKIPYQASEFAIPAGYKRVNNLVNVTFSARQNATLTDALNDLGFTSETGRKSK